VHGNLCLGKKEKGRTLEANSRKKEKKNVNMIRDLCQRIGGREKKKTLLRSLSVLSGGEYELREGLRTPSVVGIKKKKGGPKTKLELNLPGWEDKSAEKRGDTWTKDGGLIKQTLLYQKNFKKCGELKTN